METQAIGSEITTRRASFWRRLRRFRKCGGRPWSNGRSSWRPNPCASPRTGSARTATISASCRAVVRLPEIIEVHSSFVRGAFDDYGAEASKVIKDVTRNVPAV